MYFLRHGDELDTAALPASLQAPEIRQAMEELIVVSQSDLERERYKARLKFQRDQASSLQCALEEGIEKGLAKGDLIGRVRLCQHLLKLPVLSHESLQIMTLEQLTALAASLEQQAEANQRR